MPGHEATLSWDEIRKMISVENYRFARSEEWALKYKHHMERLHQEWYAVDDYCKHMFLKFPYTTGPRSRNTFYNKDVDRILKYVKDDARTEGPSIVISDNEYPYAFSPEIQHKLIWSIEELPLDDYEAFAKEHYPTEEYELMAFINPPMLKSVKMIHHAHLILRKITAPENAGQQAHQTHQGIAS